MSISKDPRTVQSCNATLKGYRKYSLRRSCVRTKEKKGEKIANDRSHFPSFLRVCARFENPSGFMGLPNFPAKRIASTNDTQAIPVFPENSFREVSATDGNFSQNKKKKSSAGKSNGMHLRIRVSLPVFLNLSSTLPLVEFLRVTATRFPFIRLDSRGEDDEGPRPANTYSSA